MILKPNLKPPFCSEHGIAMIWGETDFAFAEDGVEVVVRHIPAWVCSHDDDVAFPPGTTDELIKTVRELIGMATQTLASRPSYPRQEYLIRMAS